MLSLQEAVQKDTIKQQLHLVEQQMDAYGEFHPDRASVFDIEKPALRQQIQEMIHTIPLREFLAKSGTTGIAGAAYMVPDKLHDDIINYSMQTDIVPLIGKVVNGWEGGDLTVNITNKATYKAKQYSTGGAKPASTIETVQATITPLTFGVPLLITQTLIEDAAYGLIDYHLNEAAKAMGELSTQLAVTVLAAASDGWGTLNSGASGDADETKFSGATTTGIDTALGLLTDDRWIGNTVLLTSEAWEHSVHKTIGSETGGGAAGDFWQPAAPYENVQYPPLQEGFTFKVGNLDFLINNTDALHDGGNPGTAMTSCKTVVFDRNNALITGRKRWLQIDNYADPIRDIAGATISARQDSVSLYDDAVCVITET